MRDCVLVTGATGFVGVQVVKALCAQKRRVRAVVRPGKEHLLADKGLSVETIVTQDLFVEGADWWKAAYADVDTVVHAAWYAEVGKHQNSPKNVDCLLGTLTAGKEAVANHVRRFVGIGTFSEYDAKYGASLSVDMPLLPTNIYESTKVAAFYVLRDLFKISEREFLWCRLFSLYGEGEDPRRILAYVRQQLSAGQVAELTDGHQVRDFLDVAEAGQQIVEAALGTKQGAVNICSGIPATIRYVVERIADEYGRRDLLHFGVRQRSATDPLVTVGVK
ncbi:MAG: NAD(P)-dependent oxidoreductase [Holosporales bacterium]|nr:NAD(P)-dependent oxidoreductase [Holosporales bacterium]